MIPSLAVHLVMRSRPSKRLQTFPNPAPGRDYRIHMEISEFTCVCPMTGQPDFGTLLLEYVPDRTCVELKSLKLYIWSYRDQGAFHEAVTNEIGRASCRERGVDLGGRRIIKKKKKKHK